MSSSHPPPTQLPTLASRYQLLHELGRGGYGAVWAACDRITGDSVAVKLLSAGAEPPLVRREVAVLRMLRLPGVVRLLDEGEVDGCPFLVMDLVEGLPFPGPVGDRSWSAVAPATSALLAVLSRVHAAGVVHRDLKPANIFVAASGAVTILDFGISYGGPLDAGPASGGRVAGTPLFLAPEQISGGKVGPAADLYAVGVMLYRLLSGQSPFPHTHAAGLFHAKIHDDPPALASVAPSLPSFVADTVDALLARDPSARPRDAAEVWARLSGTLAGTSPVVSDATEVVDLASLFSGPERIFHVRSGAARLLLQRTAGAPEAVSKELYAWASAGVARRDGSFWRVDRSALDRLEAGVEASLAAGMTDARGVALSGEERRAAHRALARALAPGEPSRLLHLVLAADDEVDADESADIADEARTLALRLAREGRLGHAIQTLYEGLLACRRGRARSNVGAREEGELLRAWLLLAVQQYTPQAIDRVLYELARAAPRLPHLERLARFGLATLGGPGDLALALDGVDDGYEDEELELARRELQVFAARRAGSEKHAAVVAAAALWGQQLGGEAEARSLAWLGRLRYTEDHFSEAAELHFEAARRTAWVGIRLREMLYGAASLLEDFRHEEALQHAEEARGLAEACGHTYDEGEAEWLIRCATYRLARTRGADHELVEAVADLGVSDLEARVCLQEGTAAWREGHLVDGRDLANRAAKLWKVIGKPWSVLLARSLALACGAPAAEGSEVLELATAAVECPILGVGLQAIALLARVDPDVARGRRASLGVLLKGIPHEHMEKRIDVLSATEALSWFAEGAQ